MNNCGASGLIGTSCRVTGERCHMYEQIVAEAARNPDDAISEEKGMRGSYAGCIWQQKCLDYIDSLKAKLRNP